MPARICSTASWRRDSPDAHAVSGQVAVGLFRRLFQTASTIVTLVGLDVPAIDRAQPLRDDQIEVGVTAVMQLLARL
jgi:hypothetical protein